MPNYSKMKIEYWDVANARDLASVYNEQIANVPHCFAVSPEEFVNGLRSRKDNDHHCKDLHSEKLIVGKQNGKIVGFAHVAMGELDVDGQIKIGGLIHFLVHQPGYRPIGQAILEECEKYLCRSGASKIWAFQKFGNYRFYHFGFGNLSDQMGHIYALFHKNGYEMDDGEFFMEQAEYQITEPVLPDDLVEIVVKQQPGRGVLPGLTVQALRDGNEIGICEAVSAGECCQVDEAQDWFFVEWLGVEEEEQGKGLGRDLLQRTLWEMRKIGYKNAAISTDWKNYRALLFYTNYGYRLTDTVYGLVKSLISV